MTHAGLRRLVRMVLLAAALTACGGSSGDPQGSPDTSADVAPTPDTSPDVDPGADTHAPQPGASGTYLAVPSYTGRTVEVFGTPGDLDAMAHRATLSFTFAARPCGVAVGPDGRAYIADGSFAAFGIYTVASLLEGGEQPFVGDVGSSAINATCGVAFDAAGTLWIGDTTNGRVVGMRGATSVVGEADLVADVVLMIAGPGVTRWDDLDALHVDPAGDLWVVDYGADTITRIAAVADLPDGNHTDHVPAAQFSWAEATDGPAAGSRTFHRAGDVAVDDAGRLYVGNRDAPYVSRFDDARSLEGVVSPQPDAYLVTDLERAYLVALDPEGRLWTGNGTRVARVTGDPAAPTGVAQVGVDPVIVFSESEGAPYSTYGGMTFFAVPPGDE